MTRWQHIEFQNLDGVLHVKTLLCKLLDAQGIAVWGQELITAYDESGLKKVILDFSQVEFMTSTAIGRLLALARHMNGSRESKCLNLVLSNLREDILSVFEQTRIVPLCWRHFATVDQALAALRGENG